MPPRKELTRSQAKGRRTALSRERQDVALMNAQLLDRLKARDRLTDIQALLSPDAHSPLSLLSGLEREKARAELEIEQVWLTYKLGMISQADQQRTLSEKFNDWEQRMPDVYAYLTSINNGPSRAQQIRNRVIPPIRIAGYHTKRI